MSSRGPRRILKNTGFLKNDPRVAVSQNRAQPIIIKTKNYSRFFLQTQLFSHRFPFDKNRSVILWNEPRLLVSRNCFTFSQNGETKIGERTNRLWMHLFHIYNNAMGLEHSTDSRARPRPISIFTIDPRASADSLLLRSSRQMHLYFFPVFAMRRVSNFRELHQPSIPRLEYRNGSCISTPRIIFYAILIRYTSDEHRSIKSFVRG